MGNSFTNNSITSCRRVDNNLHIYEGIFRNPWFLGVQALTIAGQVTIVLKGGEAFQVAPITPVQWGFSILFGFLVLPIGALIRMVPDQVVVVVAHKLSPLLTPIRMVRKRKAEKKRAKAKDAEKNEQEKEPGEEYYDEKDEENIGAEPRNYDRLLGERLIIHYFSFRGQNRDPHSSASCCYLVSGEP